MNYEVKMSKELLTGLLTEGTIIHGKCTRGLPKGCKLISVTDMKESDAVLLEFKNELPPFDLGEQIDVIYEGEATKAV
jgi:hypothetical protein